MSVVEQIWLGSGPGASAARLALRPLSAAFGLAVRARRALYDADILPSFEPDVPVVSVGNLTVGGTGKTPVSAYIAARLSAQARTAVALRGYGSDEVEVHARLNPSVPVVVNADRVAAVREARARGAAIVVVDDGFQHRRLRATAHIVLLSVEQMGRPRRLLPAGPWREPLDAVRRADLVLLTRKSATQELSREVARALAPFPVPLGQVHLRPGELRRLDDDAARPLSSLQGARVLAVSAIGEPESFHRQLRDAGATVVPATFRDHHEFSGEEIRALATRAAAMGDAALVVCTLKDAVKLAPRWAGPGTPWYLSQQLVLEQGEDHLSRLLERVLDSRATATTFAG